MSTGKPFPDPPIPPPPPMFLKPAHPIERLNSKDSDEELCIWNLHGFQTKAITKIKPIIQSGPNCGIIALAMALTITSSNLTVQEIFHEAESRRFTNNGEMFSANNMSILAEHLCSKWFQVELLSEGLESHRTHVINSLLKEDLMLIPYDADRDHRPCNVRGHKAHWALVCGILSDDNDQFWVAARHGKSNYLQIWPLKDLERSNNQLTELDPKRQADDRDYVLPDGGVRTGLCSQFILLHRNA